MRRRVSLGLASLLALAGALSSCGAPQAHSTAPPAEHTAPPPAGAQPGEEAAPLGKLPSDVEPLSSSIELTVDPSREGFAGAVSIRARLAKARRTIWLHGRGLQVSKATVTTADGIERAATWEQAHESGVVALRLPQAIAPGEVTITVAYTAPWTDGAHGLYLVHQRGQAYAYTQFESIAARTVFPSFDEPRFKVPYALTLRVPKGQVVLANTNERHRAADGAAFERVEFEATKPLPSYLLAFAVGPFDVVDAGTIKAGSVARAPVPLRGIAPKGRGKEMGYALAHTGEFLRALEEYTGIPYAYGKLDIIAVPGKPGAMENPGAVTFAETLLLFEGKSPDVWQRRGYAGVMAHELAHQWFGDLVTSAYWDDIWLNEAFATWLGTRVHQAWDPGSYAALADIGSASRILRNEGNSNIRRIREPIVNSGDIDLAFDSITYEKGAAVLRMFEKWVGPEAFQRGAHQYLTTKAHGAATVDDFIAALSAAAGRDVGPSMRTFLDQAGAPTVSANVACSNGHATLELSQRRYAPLGSVASKPTLWQIPVCLKYGDASHVESTCTLLEQASASIAIPGNTCPTWVLPNADAAGYYSAEMSEPSARAILGVVGKLTAEDKFAYAVALRSGVSEGRTSVATMLDGAAALANQRPGDVATSLTGSLSRAEEWLDGSPEHDALAAWVRRTYEPVARSLSGKQPAATADDAQDLLTDVRSLLARVGHDRAVRSDLAARAKRILGVGTDGKLHVELGNVDERRLALRIAMEDIPTERAEGGLSLYDTVLDRFRGAGTDEEYYTLVRAISAVRREDLAARSRQFAFDPRLHADDMLSPISWQMLTEKTRPAAWAFVKANFDKLRARLPEPSRRALYDLPSNFCSEAEAADAEAFLTPRASEGDGTARTLRESLEDARECAVQRSKLEPQLRAYFSGRKK